ncbi:hypothetical protein L6164_015783 [Bauhinia variegata]|uniref:Uncharacterized protein n=1 Tax=Bauhinia variegata TaxID=167791 RepID=A0ACB9NRT1_BAUVA|nr:hypothetical protein L6164_015783 [Bauhinia variegata]
MGEVSRICKRTVVSTKPVEAGKYHPLSVLDRHMEKNHIRMVFYYYHTWPDKELGKITGKLRESLSEALNSFPVLTGRLITDHDKGHWKIKCNDAGVRVIEAKAKGSLHRWLKNVNREKELQLVYWEDMYYKPYFWSTFYVQLTEFEEGGLAIGLSCTHMLADPTSATSFVKAWADISLGLNMTSPPFFQPLSVRRPGNQNPYTDLIGHYSSSIQKPTSVKGTTRYTTITLGFSHQMVAACMAMAQSTGAPSPSPFGALAGLFWVCLSKIKSKGPNDGLVGLSVCLDVRKALNLDRGFFGNCMIYNKVPAIAGDLGDTRLAQAATAIREAEEKMERERIADLIEWFENNDINNPTMMNGHDLICASLETEDPYSAVFENGFNPIRVSYYVEPVAGEGQVVIFPWKAAEDILGRVAMVTVAEDEASELCKDDLLLNLSPTILMK